MPDINITGDVGAQFEVEASFEIADVGHLTEFTKVSEWRYVQSAACLMSREKVLLTEETFEWTISGENLSSEFAFFVVTALDANSVSSFRFRSEIMKTGGSHKLILIKGLLFPVSCFRERPSPSKG